MRKLNHIRRFLAIAIVLAGTIIVAVISTRIHRSNRSVEAPPRLPGNVDVSLQGIHYTETRNGVKKWDLVADKVEYNKGREVARLTGVRLVVAGTDESGAIQLTADRADYDNSSKNVTLAGNVVAQSRSGLKVVAAESVTYVAAASLLKSAGRVRINDGNLTVDGVGMVFRTDTKGFKLLSDVHASITSGMAK
jgi:LPS export ABC transporter protein LptC